MLFGKSPSSPKTVRIYCPVCDSLLGTKRNDEVKNFKCKDCKATYYFYPNNRQKPKAVLDSHKDNNCGCGRCGR